MELIKNTLKPVKIISDKDSYCFFGYYDLQPFDKSDRYHLCHRVSFFDRLPDKNDVCELGYIDTENGKFLKLSETTAWNFQQGALLRWYGNDSIVYNVRGKNGFQTEIKNIYTGESRRLPLAAANISEDGKHAQGAEFIVFYMHWGEEYQTSANTWQKTIAQKLSNLGVDMIIGSHPHVIQPVELIHSEDGQNTTVCLYSTGNCISNQRQEIMDSCPTGHTEDGLLFSFTLKKNKDGVALSGLKLIPTWVNRYKENGHNGFLYTIYPLEGPDDGAAKFGLSGAAATKSAKSYERTKAIVSAGLTECQQSIGCEITFN